MSEREREWERVGKSGKVRVRKPLRTAKEPALVYLMDSIVKCDEEDLSYIVLRQFSSINSDF